MLYNNYEELTCQVRLYMLWEFLSDWFKSGISSAEELSEYGLAVYPKLMCKAILEEDQQYLYESMSASEYWVNYQDHTVKCLTYYDFNIWYVKGLSKLLMDEGVEYCEVYNILLSTPDDDFHVKPARLKIKVTDIYNISQPFRIHFTTSPTFTLWCLPTVRRLSEDLITDNEESNKFHASFRMTYGTVV